MVDRAGATGPGDQNVPPQPKRGIGRGEAVAGEAAGPVAGDIEELVLDEIQPADAAGLAIEEDEIAGGVHRHLERSADERVERIATVDHIVAQIEGV